jgi:hypothetical protein
MSLHIDTHDTVGSTLPRSPPETGILQQGNHVAGGLFLSIIWQINMGECSPLSTGNRHFFISFRFGTAWMEIKN